MPPRPASSAPASLPSASCSSRRARQAARVEHVARAVERGRRCGPAVAARRRPSPASARPTRPKPSSTTSVPRPGGAAAADLRRAGRRRARGARPRRPRASLDHERDVALRRALRDRDHVDAAGGERREDARGDAGRAGHAVADDRDHRHVRGARLTPSTRPARDLVAERALAAPRPRARPRRSGSVKPIELSDEAWKMVETESPRRRRAANVRAAMPCTPIMPLPATVTTAWPRSVASAFTG